MIPRAMESRPINNDNPMKNSPILFEDQKWSKFCNAKEYTISFPYSMRHSMW